jgi:hypothetical protein
MPQWSNKLFWEIIIPECLNNANKQKEEAQASSFIERMFTNDAY